METQSEKLQVDLNETKVKLQEEQRQKELLQKRATSLEKENSVLLQEQNTVKQENSDLSSQVEEFKKQVQIQKNEVVKLEQQLERTVNLGGPVKKTPDDLKLESLYQAFSEKLRNRISEDEVMKQSTEDSALIQKAVEVRKRSKQELQKQSTPRTVKRSQVDFIRRSVHFLRSEKKKLKLFKNEFASTCNKLGNEYKSAGSLETKILKWEKKLDSYLRGKLQFSHDEMQDAIQECNTLLSSHNSSENNIDSLKQERLNAQNRLKDQIFQIERALKLPGYGVPATPPEMEKLRRELQDAKKRSSGDSLVIAALLDHQSKLFPTEEYSHLFNFKEPEDGSAASQSEDELPLVVAKCIDYLEDKGTSQSLMIDLITLQSAWNRRDFRQREVQI